MTDLLKKIRAELPADAVSLIYTETARRYIVGFESSLGYVFITKDSVIAFFDGRYYEAAKRYAYKGIEVRLLENIGEQGSMLLKNVGTLFVEAALSFKEASAFAKLFSKKIQPEQKIDNTISYCREVKSDYEKNCIKKAQSFAEKAFDEILHFIKPGVTERQIAAELEYRMKLFGSDDMSFKTIAITGKKTSMPHGVPDDSIVKNGDFVTMDFGAMFGGYHSDMTRTVAVGSATDEMKNVYDIVLKANLATEKAVKAGAFCSDADSAARNVISNAGYGSCFTHSTGHGVGLEIHESPNLSPKSGQVLRCGQIVTDEPGIYLQGKFGVRIEDMLFVSEKGNENLTKAVKSLIIL